jgi:DNA-binding IclR family transcriptional regulator
MKNDTVVVVPAIKRAFSILNYLGEQAKPLTLTEISSALDIPISSAYRIIKYLCSMNYISEYTG